MRASGHNRPVGISHLVLASLLGPSTAMTPNVNSVAAGSLNRKSPGRVRRPLSEPGCRWVAGTSGGRAATSLARRVTRGSGQRKDFGPKPELKIKFFRYGYMRYFKRAPYKSSLRALFQMCTPRRTRLLRRGLRGQCATCSSMGWTGQPKSQTKQAM